MDVTGTDWYAVALHAAAGLAVTSILFLLFSILKNRRKQDWLMVAKGTAAASLVAVVFAFTLALVSPAARDQQGDKLNSKSVKLAPVADERSLDGRMSASDFADIFHTALYSGDLNFVKTRFAKDATIFENGLMEPSLKLYLNTHLKAEIPTLKSAKRKVILQQSIEDEGIAVVVTSSILTFLVSGEKRNFNNVETLNLIWLDGAWRINHVHWSSRPIETR